MTYEEIKRQKNEKISKELSAIVNDLCFDYSGVSKALTLEHRALQDNFTHLCVEWLRVCAQPDYRFDDRNSFSHIIGKIVTEAINKKMEG